MDLFLDYENIENELFLLDEEFQEMLMNNLVQGEMKNENLIINEEEDMEKEKEEEDFFECGICYDHIQKNNVVYLKKCNHKFCQDCIKRVRSRKFQAPCPYCRTSFTKNDIKSLYKKNQDSNKSIKKCKCGSTTHRRTNHLSCPLNKKNLL